MPAAIAVDALGIAYIAETFAGAVYTLTPSRALTLLAGSQDATQSDPDLRYPVGIALAAARNVYVADSSTSSIVRITQTGQIMTVVPASAALGIPNDVARDVTGNLYVVDSRHDVVRRITPTGIASIIAGLENDSIQDASVDGPLGTQPTESAARHCCGCRWHGVRLGRL